MSFGSRSGALSVFGQLLIVMALVVVPLATIGVAVASVQTAGATQANGWDLTGNLPDWAVGGTYVVSGYINANTLTGDVEIDCPTTSTCTGVTGASTTPSTGNPDGEPSGTLYSSNGGTSWSGAPIGSGDGNFTFAPNSISCPASGQSFQCVAFGSDSGNSASVGLESNVGGTSYTSDGAETFVPAIQNVPARFVGGSDIDCLSPTSCSFPGSATGEPPAVGVFFGNPQSNALWAGNNPFALSSGSNFFDAQSCVPAIGCFIGGGHEPGAFILSPSSSPTGYSEDTLPADPNTGDQAVNTTALQCEADPAHPIAEADVHCEAVITDGGQGDGVNDGYPPTLISSSNGGASWTIGTLDSTSPGTQTGLDGAQFTGITCATATVCFAYGFQGSDSADIGGIIKVTVDGGAAWYDESISGTKAVDSISCPTSTDCFAGADLSNGSAGVFSTTDTGFTTIPESLIDPTNVVATPGAGSATATWTPPTDLYGDSISGYTVITSQEPGNIFVGDTFTTATSLTVSHLTAGDQYVMAVSTNTVGQNMSQSVASNTVVPLAPPGPYSPLAPTRVCDTRVGNPSHLASPATQCNGDTLSAGGTQVVHIAGNYNVPSTATAVVLNVTAVNEAGQGYMTVYPTGSALPNASNVNYPAGKPVPNLVEVGVGTGGDISVFSSAHSDLIVDVEGYVSPTAVDGSGSGLYNALASPVRICDTRAGNPSGLNSAPNNQCNGRTLEAGGVIPVNVGGWNGIPSNATAAVFNVTVVNPTGNGYLTVYPHGGTVPNSSNVNYSEGQTTSNRVIVPLGTSAGITVASSQSADVIVDVSGYFSAPGFSGAVFTAEPAPIRICDTRAGNPSGLTAPNNQCNGTANVGKPIGAGQDLPVQVTGLAGVPSGATAVVVNLTGFKPSAQTFLTVYPNALPAPLVSDLNEVPGEVKANLVVATLSSSGSINIYNKNGNENVIVDVLGWYSNPS